MKHGAMIDVISTSPPRYCHGRCSSALPQTADLFVWGACKCTLLSRHQLENCVPMREDVELTDQCVKGVRGGAHRVDVCWTVIHRKEEVCGRAHIRQGRRQQQQHGWPQPLPLRAQLRVPAIYISSWCGTSYWRSGRSVTRRQQQRLHGRSRFFLHPSCRARPTARPRQAPSTSPRTAHLWNFNTCGSAPT